MMHLLKITPFRFWAILLALPVLFFPMIDGWYTPIIFWSGLLLVGIPHGALDHHIQLGHEPISFKTLALFIAKYLTWMLVFLGFWLLFPSAAILFFILISGCHFGMVDFKHPSSLFAKLLAAFYGINLLLFLLLTHQEEAMGYWQVLRLPQTFIQTWVLLPSELAILFLLNLMGSIAFGRRHGLWWTLLLLGLGVFLPLLLVFILYFAFQHALQSSLEIKQFLQVQWKKLILMALPFSVGAYFIALLLWLSIQQSYFSVDHLAPYAFLFLGMVTLPHVVYYTFNDEKLS